MNISYLFLAPGFEEVEALATTDVMRRAGMPVRTVAVSDDNIVMGAHGIPVAADINIADAEFADAEWLICPGGMPGAENLHNCDKVNEALKAQYDRGGRVAAICASPAVVLYPLGLLDGRDATCYPGFEDKCANAKMIPVPVVATDRVITGQGPAASLKFGLAIVAASMGENVARQVADGMLYGNS